jgi:hypothetical protein
MAELLIDEARKPLLLSQLQTIGRARQARQIKEAELKALYADPCAWMEKHFFIEDFLHPGSGRGSLINLARHQKAILRYAFKADERGRYPYSTIVYSCPKKSGKTAIAAAVARWAAETWGRFSEIYCLANDFDQARGRAFASISQSIELHPDYDPGRRHLAGEWVVRDRELYHLPTGSRINAVAADYKGEAGSNPSLTLWTELWGYCSSASRRLWAEMTPSPARPNSICFVETYAGFEGESDLLEDIYKLGKKGRQLTAGEIGDLSAFVEAPNADSLIPVWVNEAAGLLMYWDEGAVAHRMPWQQGPDAEAYYREQAARLGDGQFDRLHLNKWAAAIGEAIPIEWWDACTYPLPLPPPQARDRTPLVIGVDASVSGDCTAVNVVSRHPQLKDEVVQRACRAWAPPQGGKIDYDQTVTPFVDNLVANYNVVEVAYDEYQLHLWATQQRKKAGAAWYRSFNQGADRLVADKQTKDLVIARKIHHLGDPEQRAHVQNALAKIPTDDPNKLRFVKKGQEFKIDLLVSLSMAVAECLRLNL